MRNLLLDNIAAGLDPERATIFTHSSVPALNQLMLPFLSLVSVAELQRNPTVKDEAKSAGITSIGGLLLTYPVHQAADILFCKANVVRWGATSSPTSSRPVSWHAVSTTATPPSSPSRRPASEAPLILGTDGTKMSKSKGNVVELRMTADETAKKLKGAKTDSDRVITYDPDARPEVANLLTLISLCEGVEPAVVAEEIGDGGGGALKARLTEAINTQLAPLRARRTELEADPGYLDEVLRRGNERANEVAEATLDEVRAAMGMVYL